MSLFQIALQDVLSCKLLIKRFLLQFMLYILQMYNEENPREVKVTFFESSDANKDKAEWIISLETVKGVKSLVDAIRDPWEDEFGVSLDITSTSFSEPE